MKLSPDTSKPFYKWEVVILLWIAFFLNQGGRQAFNIVLPQIQTLFGANDSTMGLIAALFNVFYAVAVPFAGFYADRLSRSKMVIVSTLIFSSATLFTGFTGGVISFIIFRCIGMGVGQGIFGPTYIGLIAQYHDSCTRGRAMSFHQTSSYLGVVVCSVLAGYIADKLGWQYACYIFGGLGVLFTGWMAIRLKDKTPVVQTQNPEQPSFKEGLSAFFKVPTAICMLIAYTAAIFTITGYLTWMPKYIKETFDLTTASAGFHSMFWMNITAFGGIIIGGIIADRIVIRSKNGANRLWLQITGILLAAPCIALMGVSQNLTVLCVILAGFGLFRSLFECSTYPVLYDVISSRYYSLSSAIMILFGFSIGALAPWILGMIGDSIGLSKGFIVLSIVWACASIALILVRLKFYNKDVLKLNSQS